MDDLIAFFLIFTSFATGVLTHGFLIDCWGPRAPTSEAELSEIPESSRIEISQRAPV